MADSVTTVVTPLMTVVYVVNSGTLVVAERDCMHLVQASVIVTVDPAELVVV